MINKVSYNPSFNGWYGVKFNPIQSKRVGEYAQAWSDLRDFNQTFVSDINHVISLEGDNPPYNYYVYVRSDREKEYEAALNGILAGNPNFKTFGFKKLDENHPQFNALQYIAKDNSNLI